jgi:hypothetical protein
MYKIRKAWGILCIYPVWQRIRNDLNAFLLVQRIFTPAEGRRRVSDFKEMINCEEAVAGARSDQVL